MKPYRLNAIVVGVLFIIGTVTGVLAAAILGPILDAPDYLAQLSAHETQVILATFLIFTMGAACAGIGLALVPVLRKFSLGLAAGAAGFRVLEGVLDMLGAVGLISLLALSQAFVAAGSPQGDYFQAAGTVIRAATD